MMYMVLKNTFQLILKTYDVNGEITFFINIEDAGTAHETLKITQSRATGNIYIDKSNETIVI